MDGIAPLGKAEALAALGFRAAIAVDDDVDMQVRLFARLHSQILGLILFLVCSTAGRRRQH
jgi:hypothetical protein